MSLCLLSCVKNNLSKKEKRYLSENPNVIIGIYVNYPPYQFVNSNGEIDGILLDYFSKLESNIGKTFKRKYYSNWQALIDDAKNKKVDVILEIQNTKERRKYLEFTDPIFIGRHIILTKENSNNKTINDLNGKKVSVGENFAIEEFLRDEHPNIIIVPKINEKACIEAVINNEVDAFIGLETITKYIITKEGYSNLKIQNALNYNNELSFAINKDKPILANIIKKGNNAITLEEKNEILNKWLYDIIKPFHKKTSFWQILLIVLASILLLSFLLSYYLKREVRKRTKELRKAKQIAEKNHELKTLFLQNVSHEFRTPLNSIVGYASFLKENHLNNTDKAEYVDTIVQQSSNLTNILNNVIEVSELTTKKPKPKNSLLCIEKELNILAEIYKIKAEHKKLSFNYNNSIKKPKSYIFSDKSRLIKAISNLLDNALKFTEKGSIALYSTIQGKQIIIRIIDTGIGIGKDKTKAVFDEFYQVEKELSKKYDGLGIGLTTAKENIKSLGGNLTLDNSIEKVTSFIITLPYDPNLKKEVKNNAPKHINSKFKILIAEDMKLNYIVLEKMLNKIILNDKEITWAKNGQEAIDYVKKNSFDIIFMDIKMPVLDGYQASSKIKSLHPEIPIVAQTAYTREEDYNKAIAIGFDDYLTKPINSNALKIILQDYFAIKITSD